MLKKIITIMSIITILGANTINSSAQTNDSTNEENEFYYEVDFTELGITTKEIESMTTGEYYRKFFPELWSNLTEDEKEYYNQTPFLEKENESRVIVPSIEYTGLSYLTTNAFSKSLTATAKSIKTGKLVATSITHNMYIDDSKGNAVAGSVSSTSSSTYTTKLSKPKVTNVPGLKYRARTIHEWKVKSKNYKATSTSSWMTVK